MKRGQQILMEQVYTDEWCQAMESVLVDLAKVISSINEPRWMTQKDSLKIDGVGGTIKIHSGFIENSAHLNR